LSRFLFVVLPLAGHINAPLAVSDALLGEGHEVAWCGPETFLRPLVGPDATVYPTGRRYYPEQGQRGLAALRTLWEAYLVPLAHFVLPVAERAVTEFRPDVVVADQHALAGALVAHRHGLPWASLALGALELTRPLRSDPDVEALVRTNLNHVRTLAGLAPDDGVDPRFSPHLVLGFTTSALTGSAALPDTCVLVGPAIGRRGIEAAFDWDWLDDPRRHVLVTVGTLADGIARDFLDRSVRALRDLADRVRAVVVAPADAVADPPDHILVTPRVPLLELMPRLDAVVCHGGMGTVCDALTHGVPLVIAPIRHDQPVVADQVVAAGAGVRIGFFESTPEQVRAAVTTVLDDPSHRAAAGRVAESFAAAGGAPAAATHLIRLADRTRERVTR
jgi:UDP:flavonoid glycosyltransferase YjiC (YdhE family)